MTEKDGLGRGQPPFCHAHCLARESSFKVHEHHVSDSEPSPGDGVTEPLKLLSSFSLRNDNFIGERSH